MTLSKIDITVNGDDYGNIRYFKEFFEAALSSSFWRDSFQVGNILINEKTKNFVLSVILSMPRTETPLNRQPIKLVEVK